MRDRESTKILPNGAVRYGIYDASGSLLRYEYIRLEDEPTVQGSFWNRANVLPDDTVARIFDSAGESPDDPQVKDALDRLNHQVGEIITTRRTDLGDHWALCNGEYMDAYKAPELYRMSRESYEYDIVHELDGEHKIQDANYTSQIQAGAVVVNNTVYQAVLDAEAAVINLYKWVGDDKEYGPVLVQIIGLHTEVSRIYISKCAEWVFIEAAYQSGNSNYKRAFFAANQSDMVFYPVSYLVEGDYAFPAGGGNSGSATATWTTDFVYCKIKADGTMGIAMSAVTNYSNSSGYNPRMQMRILEIVNGKWMCVKVFATKQYVELSNSTYSVYPYYNPYLGVWQMCTQSYNDTYVYLRSIDVAACYESGELVVVTATTYIWSADGRDYVYGIAWDTGSAIWLIPDYYNVDDYAMNYVIQVDSVTEPSKLQAMGGTTYVDTIRVYDGRIFGFSARRSAPGITIYESIEALINDSGTVLTNSLDYGSVNNWPPVTNDIAFGQGLYDHVLTGYGIQTPGYRLPAIAPDASYAYIKIKEATDD